MHGPVSPDSLSLSSWVRISSICSRWDGMLVSVTGALSSKEEKMQKVDALLQPAASNRHKPARHFPRGNGADPKRTQRNR